MELLLIYSWYKHRQTIAYWQSVARRQTGFLEDYFYNNIANISKTIANIDA
jgi:hypothetical protein